MISLIYLFAVIGPVTGVLMESSDDDFVSMPKVCSNHKCKTFLNLCIDFEF